MENHVTHKRKRIAVFLGEIGREYQKFFVKSLKEIVCSMGYDVFVFNDFGAYLTTDLFDIGERDVINIPDFSEYEGVISLPDTFDIAGMEQILIDRIKSQTNCPIVSVRNGSYDSYRVVFDNYGTIYKMVNHFIDHHGFTNICFMSGPLTYEDSVDRLNGFKAAMADAGLEVTDDIIIEGDFWKKMSKQAADKFLKAYDGKTQAIICANDYMALGLKDELISRGIRIPEDIAITGFDEIVEGMLTSTPLTTVAIPITEMINNAMSIIERVNKGEEVPKEIRITGDILYKRSCGCDRHTNDSDLSQYITLVTDEYVNIRRSLLFATDIQNTITEEEKLSFISKYTNIFSFKKTYLCLCTDDYKDDNPYSETMKLHSIFPYNEESTSSNIIDKTFPRGHILPDGFYDNDEPNCYIVIPIHHKQSTFGFVVFEWDKLDDTTFYAPYAEGIALAYNDLKLQEQFSDYIDIKKQTLIDSLTGIYNRRGLDQELPLIIKKAKKESTYVSFICCDLDDLKRINDTYGHSEGDYAIKTTAKALKEITGSDNICARIGGDEFFAVITSPDIEVHQSIIDSFNQVLKQYSDSSNKEYVIHASIGVSTVQGSTITNPYNHLHKADKNMYESKKLYKESIR